MDQFLSRYRNLSLLILVVFAQLMLLGFQVRTANDARLVRVWAVAAVTPLARTIEAVRHSTADWLHHYVLLRGAQTENDRLKRELESLRLDNQYLRSELATSDRAEALAAFQKQTQSRTVAARVIAAGTGSRAHVVFVDRGSADGVMRGMGVITPNGIVGKVIAAYRGAAQVLLINDPAFAAGVITAGKRIPATLKGAGQTECTLDYVANEAAIEVGEWIYTSGLDRVFPKGLPVGKVSRLRDGTLFKQIWVKPAATESGVEEVLIVVEGVHGEIPAEAPDQAISTLAPPAPTQEQGSGRSPAAPSYRGPMTDADRIRAEHSQPKPTASRAAPASASDSAATPPVP